MRWRTSIGRNHVSLPHFGGLDGLRGIAVVAVILYHGGVSWVPGGLLGVEMFFVLSGFLITSLLVAEWTRSGTIALSGFWARRARRLLPALFTLVLVIGIYYALAGSAKALPDLRGDGISTLFYFNNWHQIANRTNYFVASGPVSPLQHTWSLAIEEQFYLVWPLVVLAVLGLTARRGAPARRSLAILLGLSLAGAAASAVDMALLVGAGRGLDRVYYGTDSRATGLLIGASLAAALAIRSRGPGRRPGPLTARRRLVLGLVALVGLCAVVAAAVLVAGSSRWLYPEGLLGVDFAMVAVIGAVVLAPGTPVARLLSLAPVRGIGVISYGMYLWHFPLFLWLDESSTGLEGPALLGVRVAATLAVSLISYWLVEQPIRRGRRPAWQVRTLAPIGAAAALGSLLMASAAASLPVGTPTAAKIPKPPPGLAGNAGPCTERLADTSAYGLAPLSRAKEAKFEYKTLGYSSLVWSGTATRTFRTCPPKRVMVVGDSLAFTAGLPMMDDEQDYGMEIANAATLGCAFASKGQLDLNGTWVNPPAGCPQAVSRWAADERALHPKELIVELGYRDEFDWRWNGKVVHLGQPAFDAYVQRQIRHFVRVLGRGGVKILFLSVPYAHPPAQADGTPSPAAAPNRRTRINEMLAAEARSHPRTVHLLNIDSIVSPGNHYNQRLHGQICRFDGVHFSVFCSKLMEPTVLGEARRLLKDH